MVIDGVFEGERDKYSGYQPISWGIEDLRPPKSEPNEIHIRWDIQSLRYKFPKFFESSLLALAYRNVSAKTNIPTMGVPENVADSYIKDLADFLKQPGFVAKISRNLVVGAGGRRDMFPFDFNHEKKIPAGDIWPTELMTDSTINQGAGVYRLGVDTGNCTPDQVVTGFLQHALAGYCDNQIAMKPSEQDYYEKIKQILGVGLQYKLPYSDVSQWNVWVDHSNGKPKFVGRSNVFEDMYIRFVVQKGGGVSSFLDVKIGELLCGDFVDNVTKIVTSEQTDFVNKEPKKIESNDKTNGPPLFAVTIDNSVASTTGIFKDGDPLIDRGMVVCHFVVKPDLGLGMLCPSHMSVDGKVMAKLVNELHLCYGVKSPNLLKFYPMDLPGMPGWHYGVRTRPEMTGSRVNFFTESLGISEVEVGMLPPDWVVEIQEKLSSRMEKKLGIVGVAGLETEFALLGIKNSMAEQILSPRHGPYGLAVLTMTTYRSREMSRLKKSGWPVSGNGDGISTVVCVPTVNKYNRLGIAGGGPRSQNGIVRHAWMQARQFLAGGKNVNIEITNDNVDKPMTIAYKIYVLSKLSELQKFVSQFKKTISAGSLGLNELWMKHYVGKNRKAVSTIAGFLNPQMAGQLKIGAQLSALKDQPYFGTAMSGEPTIEMVEGITEKSSSIKFAVGCGINLSRMREKIFKAATRLSEHKIDNETWVLWNILKRTGYNGFEEINLELVSKNVEKLRKSSDPNDRSLADEAVMVFVISTCREIASEILLTRVFTALKYLKIFEDAEKMKINMPKKY